MILSCSSQVDGHHLFLKTEAMLALNQSLGSFPLSIEHWRIAHIVGTSWWAQVFSIMFGIRSGPWALLILILRRHFLTPSTVHGQGVWVSLLYSCVWEEGVILFNSED